MEHTRTCVENRKQSNNNNNNNNNKQNEIIDTHSDSKKYTDIYIYIHINQSNSSISSFPCLHPFIDDRPPTVRSTWNHWTTNDDVASSAHHRHRHHGRHRASTGHHHEN